MIDLLSHPVARTLTSFLHLDIPPHTMCGGFLGGYLRRTTQHGVLSPRHLSVIEPRRTLASSPLFFAFSLPGTLGVASTEDAPNLAYLTPITQHPEHRIHAHTTYCTCSYSLTGSHSVGFKRMLYHQSAHTGGI